MLNRGTISFDDNLQNLKDIAVSVLCMAGGRLRQRKKKRGRKPATLKRQGYTTDLVEPKLLTMINLRLKGAGIFWTAEMVEVMLFLCSQFLCGR